MGSVGSAERKAPIEMDITDKQLGSITAAEFITALNSGALGAYKLTALPEKKKVELELEPGVLAKIRVKDLIHSLGEKKKVELEKDVRIEASKSIASEVIRDPRDLVTNPEFISQVAREVAARLR